MIYFIKRNHPNYYAIFNIFSDGYISYSKWHKSFIECASRPAYPSQYKDISTVLMGEDATIVEEFPSAVACKSKYPEYFI